MDSAASRIPGELWQAIIPQAQLSLATLFELALTCRALYHISLTTYIANLGIYNPERKIEFLLADSTGRRTHDAVTSLRLPFFVGSTDELVCTFLQAKTPTQMLHHIVRLQAVVDRMAHLKRVTLNFRPAMQKEHESTHGDIDEHLHAWSTTFGRLLNSILERGCESLHFCGLKNMVEGGYRFVPVFPNTSLVTTSFGSIRKALGQHLGHNDGDHPESIINAEHWRFERIQVGADHIVTRLSDSARKNTKLQHFTIGSSCLLMPPLLQWMYSALLASPIESLKISDHMSHFKDLHFPWTSLIQLLAKATPNLKSLELDSIFQSSFESLNGSLGLFQNLKILSLSGIELPWYSLLHQSDIPSTLPTLPNLVELRVPNNWFINSFTVAGVQTHLPNLQHLIVDFDHNVNITQGSNSVAHALFKELTLRQSEGQIPYSITMKVRFGPRMYHLMAQSVLAEEPMVNWSGCISTLALAVGESPLEGEEDLDRAFMPWLNQFPNLKGLLIGPDPDEANVAFYERCAIALGDKVPQSIIRRLTRFRVNAVDKV